MSAISPQAEAMYPRHPLSVRTSPAVNLPPGYSGVQNSAIADLVVGKTSPSVRPDLSRGSKPETGALAQPLPPIFRSSMGAVA